MYISEVWFQRPEVSSVLWPYHYKAMGKYSNALYPESTTWNMLIIACFSHIRSLSSKNLNSDPMTSPSGHSRSFEVKFVLWFKLLIELRKGTEDDPNVLLSHRQIARYVTCAIGSPRGLLWPWPDVKLWPWLFMGKMHIFRHVLTRGTRWPPNYVTRFLSSKVFAKTIFVQNHYFYLSWPGRAWILLR